MDIFVNNITKHLVKYYNIRLIVAEAIVEDEWEYIENEYILGSSVYSVSKNLVDVCMVA